MKHYVQMHNRGSVFAQYVTEHKSSPYITELNGCICTNNVFLSLDLWVMVETRFTGHEHSTVPQYDINYKWKLYFILFFFFYQNCRTDMWSASHMEKKNVPHPTILAGVLLQLISCPVLLPPASRVHMKPLMSHASETSEVRGGHLQ